MRPRFAARGVTAASRAVIFAGAAVAVLIDVQRGQRVEEQASVRLPRAELACLFHR